VGGAVRAEVSNSREGSVEISVSDTGIGIPAHSLPHLFERFSRLSHPGTSGEATTGLRMTIVKEFVEAHAGTVSVENTLVVGTVFRVTLPRAAAALPVVATETATADRRAVLQRRVRGLRVLVADDAPVNQRVAGAVLTNAGCSVELVADGQSAFEEVIAARLAYDAVFMDVEMPGMDGLSAPPVTRDSRSSRSRGTRRAPIASAAWKTE